MFVTVQYTSCKANYNMKTILSVCSTYLFLDHLRAKYGDCNVTFTKVASYMWGVYGCSNTHKYGTRTHTCTCMHTHTYTHTQHMCTYTQSTTHRC